VLILVFFRSQGDADRSLPCARQGAQVRSACADEAAVVEGATGGGGGRAVVRHDCGHGATTRSGGSSIDHGGVDVAAPIPAAGDKAVADIAADDALPPGWGQWGNRPASAPEPTAGVLVMREDGSVMPRRSVHDAEASSSRAVPPAPDVVVAPQCRSGVTPSRRRLVSTRPGPSRRCGRSFETTTPRSTTR
jgi:hypothetical protein